MERFINAQGEWWDTALEEIKSGEKRTHWIWFISPQAAGLGKSITAIKYAINSLAEAEEFLEHEILGTRLREISRVLLKQILRHGF